MGRPKGKTTPFIFFGGKAGRRRAFEGGRRHFGGIEEGRGLGVWGFSEPEEAVALGRFEEGIGARGKAGQIDQKDPFAGRQGIRAEAKAFFVSLQTKVGRASEGLKSDLSKVGQTAKMDRPDLIALAQDDRKGWIALMSEEIAEEGDRESLGVGRDPKAEKVIQMKFDGACERKPLPLVTRLALQDDVVPALLGRSRDLQGKPFPVSDDRKGSAWGVPCKEKLEKSFVVFDKGLRKPDLAMFEEDLGIFGIFGVAATDEEAIKGLARRGKKAGRCFGKREGQRRVEIQTCRGGIRRWESFGGIAAVVAKRKSVQGEAIFFKEEGRGQRQLFVEAGRKDRKRGR